ERRASRWGAGDRHRNRGVGRRSGRVVERAVVVARAPRQGRSDGQRAGRRRAHRRTTTRRSHRPPPERRGTPKPAMVNDVVVLAHPLRARGARQQPPSSLVAQRIIPAYAGNTSTATTCRG